MQHCFTIKSNLNEVVALKLRIYDELIFEFQNFQKSSKWVWSFDVELVKNFEIMNFSWIRPFENPYLTQCKLNNSLDSFLLDFDHM